MTTHAFPGGVERREPWVRLRPLAAGRFVAAAADDRPLLALMEAYEAEVRAHAPDLPPVDSFRPERLLTFGMTARAGFLDAGGDEPPHGLSRKLSAAVAASLTRALAGPQLHHRPARFRLTTSEGSRLLLLLPFRSGEQGEVAQVLAAFGT